MEHAGHISEANAQPTRLMQGRDTRWWRGNLAKTNLILLLLLITSMTNGYDGSMMNGLQSVDTWQAYFGTPQGSLLGIFNAIQSIGGIVGLPFAPIISDWLGRRASIFLGACIMLIGTAIQTGAQNVGMFIGARFLIGFGLSFSCLSAPVLITELAFPTHRGPVTSLYNSTWYLGSIVAAWVTYGTFPLRNSWGWRAPSLLQGLPSVIQFFLIFLIPESPRWLVNRGKVEQAHRILAKLHCNGDMNDPLAQFEIREIEEAIRIESLAAKTSYLSLFKTPGNRRRMAVIIPIAFFSQWSGNGIVSYYLSKALIGIGIKSSGQQVSDGWVVVADVKLTINGVLQVYNLVTAYIGALAVDKAGRRTLFLTSAGGMCMSYMTWTIAAALYAKSAVEVDAAGDPLNPNKNAGNTVLAAIFFFYGFYNLAMSPLLVSYTVEILPYKIRTKGLMVMQMSVNASLVFNQYVNPLAMEALDWRYYIIYTCFLAFEVVYLYFTVLETKGKDGPLPLEEIAVLFDKDDKSNLLEGVGIGGEESRRDTYIGDLDKKDSGDLQIENGEKKPTTTLV